MEVLPHQKSFFSGQRTKQSVGGEGGLIFYKLQILIQQRFFYQKHLGMKPTIHFIRGMFPIPIFLDTKSGTKSPNLMNPQKARFCLGRNLYPKRAYMIHKRGRSYLTILRCYDFRQKLQNFTEEIQGVGGQGPLSWTLSKKKFFLGRLPMEFQEIQPSTRNFGQCQFFENVDFNSHNIFGDGSKCLFFDSSE